METSCKAIASKISSDSDPTILTEGVSYANISSKFLENGDTNKLEKMGDDENDNVVDINGKMGLDNFVVDSFDYRVCSDGSEDSSSDSDSIDSSSSCSSLSSENEETKEETSVTKAFMPRTKGELCLEDLPKVDELNISVPECELKALGKIFSTVQEILVVASFKNSPPLDMDSILFLSSGKAIGSVFETWGPVIEPYYSIRFNSAAKLEEKGFIMGDTVYYAPENKGVTSYVFVDELRTQKGSDASWTDNNEPPVECLDYSDDEQEREARLKRRAKNRSVSVIDEIPKKMPTVAVESPRATVQNIVSSQGQTFTPFQQSTFQFRNSVSQFPRGFIRTAHSRPIVPTNFIVGPNPLFRPGQLPLMSPRPVFFQSPRFPMSPYPAPNGWATQQAAATFQMLNQQRIAMPNVQNKPINSGQTSNDGSSQLNPGGIPERNLNSTTSSLSTCDTSPTVSNESNKGMQFRPNNPSLAPNMSSYSAVMATRTPVLFNPRGFATSFPINPATMTPMYHVQHPPAVNRPISNSQNYEGAPLRMPSGPTFNVINGTSLRQQNSNVHTMSTSSSSVPLPQHLQINSPSSGNLNPGNEYPTSKEMIPQTPSAASISSVGLSPSVPRFHHVRASIPTSTTSNGHVLHMPNISSCHTQNQTSPFVSTAVPTLRTWHPMQQPVFGVLPNVFGQNRPMMFGMPVQGSIPSAGVITPTNMTASLRPGTTHAKPRVLLQTPNVIPPFDPRVPPPSCD